MTGLTVRPAEGSDAAALVRVYHSAYRENRELGFPMNAESVTEAEVREWIRDHTVLVAEDGDTVGCEVDDVGEVIAGVRLEATGEDRVKLSRLGVHEGRKGQGVGGQLLDRAEDRIREHGYGTVWLTTPPEHPFLPDFYRDRGYEKTGDHPLDFREYDEIVLEKRLD